MKPIVDSLKVLGESTKTLESLRDNLFAPKKLKFNSQICTTREQSKRLLALGLKKETADCHWAYHSVTATRYIVAHPCDGVGECIPAWSLHRLIEMAGSTKTIKINEGRCEEYELWFAMDECRCWNNHKLFSEANLYDSLINCIEYLIKEGYLNKEYLV